MNEKKLGQAIAKARIARHMTPRTLAEKLMVDEETILAWETGAAAPAQGDLSAIAEALALDVSLFTAEEEADFSTGSEENPLQDWKVQRTFWEKKWKEDHKALRYGYFALVVLFVVLGIFLGNVLLNALGCLVAIGGYLKLNNDKMIYIESKIPMKEE